MPSGGGNTSDYEVDAFNALNFNNVIGAWDIGTYPSMVFFNPVKDILYGTNESPNDNYLYIMDTNNYSVNRLQFFNDLDL